MADAVASNNREALALPAPSRASRAPAGSGAVQTLRLLVLGPIVAPLLFGLVAAYFSYRATYQHATAALAEAVAVAHENTTKVLDTYMLVAARIEDVLAGLSDADIRGEEAQLHARLAEQIEDLPQVAA